MAVRARLWVLALVLLAVGGTHAVGVNHRRQRERTGVPRVYSDASSDKSSNHLHMNIEDEAEDEAAALEELQAQHDMDASVPRFREQTRPSQTTGGAAQQQQQQQQQSSSKPNLSVEDLTDPPNSEASKTEQDLIKLQALLKEDPPKRPDVPMPDLSKVTKQDSNASKTAPKASSGDKASTDGSLGDIGSGDDLLAGLQLPEKSYIDTTGYNRLRHMVLRIRNNIVYEQLASEKDHKQNNKLCNETLTRLNSTIDELHGRMERANKSIAHSQNVIARAGPRIEKLSERIAPKEQELERVKGELFDRKASREAERKANLASQQDTVVVISAVRSIFDRLDNSSYKGQSSERFREELSVVKEQVADTRLHSLIEAAMSVVNSNTGSGKGSDAFNTKDITNLRKLMALLLNELDQYSATLKKREEQASALWTATQGQLEEQQKFLTEVVGQLKGQRQTRQDKVQKMRVDLMEAQAKLATIPAELRELASQKKTWLKDCREKDEMYHQEVTDRRVQLSTLDALWKMQALAEDDTAAKLLNVVTRNIILPRHMVNKRGERCCRVCKSGKACGDGCTMAGFKCEATSGCACNYDEVTPLPKEYRYMPPAEQDDIKKASKKTEEISSQTAGELSISEGKLPGQKDATEAADATAAAQVERK